MRRVRALAVRAPTSDAAPRADARPAVGRIHFVDLLRLIASFQMVQGHTLDALLAEELRHGAAFDAWTWVRGLTSVSFMVAAGMSFHLSTLSRFDAHVSDRAAVMKRFRRGAWLVLVGYLLHFPTGLFGGDATEAARALREFQIADVLQCIGVSILLLETITVLAGRPRQVVVASGVLAALAIGLAPLTDGVDPSGPFRFALNYLTHAGGSLFPLLPWAGYVFAGVVAAEVALPRGARTDAALPAPRLAACAAFVLGLATLGSLTLPGTLADAVRTNAAPAPGLLKLGVVIAIAAALAAASRRLVKLPRPLAVLSRETLVLYVSHLLVLYASGVGLYRWIGPRLSLGEAIVAALSMIAATAIVGWIAHALRRRGHAGRQSAHR